MNDEDIQKSRLRLDEERLELEKRKLEQEVTFSKKYGPVLFGILGTIIAGLFAIAQVMVANIQKSKEIDTANILKEKEISIATANNQARLNLDIAEFVFENREIIFSTENNQEQRRIINVIIVTFPPDISAALLDNLKAAVPEKQKATVEEGRQLVGNIQLKQATQGKLYYVIAMTSEKKSDITNEINRIKEKIGDTSFNKDFPDIEAYAPEGGLYTLLISSRGLPYNEAGELKKRAMQVGFSSGTWLWQNNVEYFSLKNK